MKGMHPDGIVLVVMGYRYNSKVTLHFAATEDGGSIRAGKPYEMKYADEHGKCMCA